MARDNICYHWTLYKPVEKNGIKKLKPLMFSSSLISPFFEQFSFTGAKLNNDNLLTLQRHSLKALETQREKV